MKTVKGITNDNVINGSAYLLNQLECCKDEIRVICNDGRVDINANTMNFTYLGKFGSAVLSHCINRDCLDKPTEKLIVLSAYMELYSRNNGGFNIELR